MRQEEEKQKEEEERQRQVDAQRQREEEEARRQEEEEKKQRDEEEKRWKDEEKKWKDEEEKRQKDEEKKRLEEVAKRAKASFKKSGTDTSKGNGKGKKERPMTRLQSPPIPTVVSPMKRNQRSLGHPKKRRQRFQKAAPRTQGPPHIASPPTKFVAHCRWLSCQHRFCIGVYWTNYISPFCIAIPCLVVCDNQVYT